ncbi:unnamed protein product [Diplocarpon coronariae]
MHCSSPALSAAALALNAFVVGAISIHEINGPRFLSPYEGKMVEDISGTVTAIDRWGFWMRDTNPIFDGKASNSIYVQSIGTGVDIEVGDTVLISEARVEERKDHRYHVPVTQLKTPLRINMLSKGNEVTPVVLDESSPVPTTNYSSLDYGGIFGSISGSSEISRVNPELQPLKFGMDYWETLSGELVTIKAPKMIASAGFFKELWIVGKWEVTGMNERGGLTATEKDANPEALVVYPPFDETSNPINLKIGDSLDDITGILTASSGYYMIKPLTAVKAGDSVASAKAPPTSLESSGNCTQLTFATYHVYQLSPKSSSLTPIAIQIIESLQLPDVIFLQGIQDSSGPLDDGVVDATKTMQHLVDEIFDISKTSYNWVEVAPENNQDAGPRGSNIRQVYLYKHSLLRLSDPNQGKAHDINDVLEGPQLKYNPGRIQPLQYSSQGNYKQVAAAWETVDGANKFFTVNIHLANKAGATPLHGDRRPPTSGNGVTRFMQAQIAGEFIGQILKKDPAAKVIAAGDFNDHSFSEPVKVFAQKSGLLDLDDVAGISPVERYTIVHKMNGEAPDHIFVSEALKEGAEFEHIHLNTWVTLENEIASHDPSVARLNVCS